MSEAYRVTIPIHVLADSPIKAAIDAMEIIRNEPMEPVVQVETLDQNPVGVLRIDTSTYEVTDEYYEARTFKESF
jgi:hypothetical protein